ncbi:niemann-Pick C1 protein-like isoform X1 [Hibiscus syriacus]|uniref:Niemann-Pick C1 protein-like isoform X1 n=1 Tax=Hibiscus syriacus TaxID=106335 RepID=A0A6A3BL95_HIBSY|nr:protein NLP4-like [Hibiscus syriacus]KAE8717085.1 niemann-Pick C1 protein-like isoform X1 [Hibiscus syriacus]
MEDSIFSPGMYLDYMDELLLDGCWLETSPTEGSDFLNPNVFFDHGFLWPSSDSIAGDFGGSLIQGENEISVLPGYSHMNQTHSQGTNFSHNMVDDVEPTHNLNGDCITEASELSRRWWIGPRTNQGPSTSVMQRLIGALNHIKDVAQEKDVLVQLWLPINKEGKRVLTTNEHPFSLDPNSQRLASYRNISVKYQFSVEEDSKDMAGLPGRVFLSKIPEWTPDVRFFRSDEYPRVDHAQQHDVRGTFALPVFEQGSRTCLGVIEVVMTTEKIKIRPELETVCKALEAVNLRSSITSTTENIKACDRSYQAALPEIKEVLRCACESHRLPLAQTWVSCMQQGKEGCRHSIENYIHCVSTVDDACYIVEPDIRGFHEACSEHHLLKGQGVAGRAFMTNQPCFSTDITSFKKTEYPLAHHARMFKLHAAVAIRLRCIHTGEADYVLEFFLPAYCRDLEGKKEMLNSLSRVIQQVCCSLRVVTNKELEEETDLTVGELIAPSDGITSTEESSKEQCTHHSEKYSRENPSWTAGLTDVKQSSSSSTNTTTVHRKEKARVVTVTDKILSKVKRHQQRISLRFGCGDSTVNEISFSSVAKGKTGEKRRSKAEKTVTLQVLRQYFAGSLKEAAKSLGVCPTTLKRICRQHGIKRWPSRTIKKVGHNLQKLQHYIDSVQGASGAFHTSAMHPNFPETASPRSSGKSALLASNSGMNGKPKQTTLQPEGGNFGSQAATSNSPSASCSQSSDSSHTSSSGTHQLSKFNMSSNEGLIIREKSGDGELKRITSEAEQHTSSHGLSFRSQSLTYFKEQVAPDSIHPIITKNTNPIAQDLDAQRVKVTYGDVKIRFRMQSRWQFKDLVHEIGRRFNIDDIAGFDLKYLDDDSEWVLLTCDADLEECIDVNGWSEGNTIKLLLQVSHRHLEQSSGSTAPS